LALTALFVREIERVEDDGDRQDELGKVLEEGWEGKSFCFDCKGVNADEVCEEVGGRGKDGDCVWEDQVQEFASDEECEAMENQNDGANSRHRCSKRFRGVGSKSRNGDSRLRSHASG